MRFELRTHGHNTSALAIQLHNKIQVCLSKKWIKVIITLDITTWLIHKEREKDGQSSIGYHFFHYPYEFIKSFNKGYRIYTKSELYKPVHWCHFQFLLCMCVCVFNYILAWITKLRATIFFCFVFNVPHQCQNLGLVCWSKQNL